MLDGRQRRDEEMVVMLTDYQKHLRTLEGEEHDFLSTMETSNAAVHQLEEEDAALPIDLDQQKQITERKIADSVSELQITLDQQKLLQVQLQGLREENTHIVIKASKLDQLVEELTSDKLRLTTELKRLVQERERREEELDAELRTCREHVQGLEVQKSTAGSLVQDLLTRIRELEEDNKQLTAVSNDASQSAQHLWEENTRLIEGYNRLEQEKQAHEGERMELVAGIQTVWEQLHAANDREALLASELQGLSDRRDAEEAFFGLKVRDLESQLEACVQKKIELSSKSEEVSQVLEDLRRETSQALKDLREQKEQLVHEVSDHLKLIEETKQAVSISQISWETQVKGLESEKASAMSTVGDLEQQLQTSREKIMELEEKDVNSIQVIEELRELITRLRSEIVKLEEVKERQEGERLELAVELQAAWDQIQAVRFSESNLATELSDLKEVSNGEKMRADGLVQELRQHIQELEEGMSAASTNVDQLSKRLSKLVKEQELQDENERLTSEIVVLEKEKERVLIENAALLVGTQTLQGRVESLELDKNKMACEIEELNQWLQGPTAEKKQLAANLDEMAQLLKSLEVERDQLVTTVSELQQERERLQKDSKSLQDAIDVQEEEKANILLSHKDLSRHVESLGEEKQQAMRVHEGFALVVRHLNEKIHVVEEEATRIRSERDVALLRLQGLEEGKTVMENLLDEQSICLNELRTENKDLSRHVESLVEEKQQAVRVHEGFALVVRHLNEKIHVFEEEATRIRSERDDALLRLQGLEEGKTVMENLLDEQSICLNELRTENKDLSRHVESLVEEKQQAVRVHEGFALVVRHLNEKIHVFEEEATRIVSERDDALLRLQGVEEVKTVMEKLLDEQSISLNEFRTEIEEHMVAAGKLEEMLAERLTEVQLLKDQVLIQEGECSNLKIVHETILDKLQVVETAKSEAEKSLEEVVALNSNLMEQLSNSESKKEMNIRLEDEVMSVSEEKTQVVQSLEVSRLLVQELHVKNSELSETINRLEEELVKEHDEFKSLSGRVSGLENEKEKYSSLLATCPVRTVGGREA